MSLIKKKKKTEEYDDPYYLDLAKAARHLGISPDLIRKGQVDLPVIVMTKSARPKLLVRAVDVDRLKAVRDGAAGIKD